MVDSKADRVTRAWADDMSPHVSPPPSQRAADQAAAGSTSEGGTAGAAGGHGARTDEPLEKDTTTGNTDKMVTKTTATERPESHSSTSGSLRPNRRRVYEVSTLDNGRSMLSPSNTIVPECNDPGLVFNETLPILHKDGRLIQIDAHLREDASVLIMRSLTDDEQAIWDEMVQDDDGMEPILSQRLQEGEWSQEVHEEIVANRRWLETHGPGRML